ncbi:g5185 [Coccomyxa elongata]
MKELAAQATDSVIDQLFGLLAMEPDKVKKQLPAAQTNRLPAHGEAHRVSASKTLVNPQHADAYVPDTDTSSFGDVTAAEPGNADAIATPLTQLQTAAYLAGFAHALGQQRSRSSSPVVQPTCKDGAHMRSIRTAAWSFQCRGTCDDCQCRGPPSLLGLITSLGSSSLPDCPPPPGTFAFGACAGLSPEQANSFNGAWARWRQTTRQAWSRWIQS